MKEGIKAPPKQKPMAPFQTTYSSNITNMEGYMKATNMESTNQDEFHGISY